MLLWVRISCNIWQVVSSHGCLPFEYTSCADNYVPIKSTCGRQCVTMFLDPRIAATQPADQIRMEFTMKNSPNIEKDVPYHGGFAYIHNPEDDAFDTSYTNNNYLVLVAGYYHLLSLESFDTYQQKNILGGYKLLKKQWRAFVQNAPLQLQPNQSADTVVIDLTYQNLQVDDYKFTHNIGLREWTSDMGAIPSYATGILLVGWLFWRMCVSRCCGSVCSIGKHHKDQDESHEVHVQYDYK